MTSVLSLPSSEIYMLSSYRLFNHLTIFLYITTQLYQDKDGAVDALGGGLEKMDEAWKTVIV